MPNHVTKQFMECLNSTNEPFFTTETQFVSGSFLLTVLPNLDAEIVRSYRLEFPADDRLNECPYPFLLLTYLFDLDALIALRPRVSQAFKDGSSLTDRIEGWEFRLFPERHHWVMEVEVMSRDV
jgi:hypothetical protein